MSTSVSALAGIDGGDVIIKEGRGIEIGMVGVVLLKLRRDS